MKKVQLDLEKLYGALRRRASVTLAAEILGLTPDALYRRLRGENKFPLEDLNTLCEWLDRDASEFLIFFED